MVAGRRRPLGGGIETDRERRGPLAPRHSSVLDQLLVPDETYKRKKL
jgi:hypothetical protein